MRYIKLWDGIASDWRYSNSPLHGWLFIHCLLEAWHADAKEFKRGTFRTSYQKLADKTGLSFSTVKRKLKDLSTGDNPEIILSTNRYGSGYTDITILNYDKYQINGSERTSNGSQRTSNGSERTSNGSQRATKEEEEKNNKLENEKITNEVFLSRLRLYPKTPNKYDLTFFNNLPDDIQDTFSKFIEEISNIWNKHGERGKTGFIKKIEDIVKAYLNNEIILDSNDPIVISTLLKINIPIKKEDTTPTYQDIMKKRKEEEERMMKMIQEKNKEKLAQQQNNN